VDSSKTKVPPTWLGKHPILDERHANDLEQAAALNEFHRKMPREEAEHAAHEEYRRTHHASAAAHHYAGMRAAQGAGDMDESKKHGDLYAQHMKALGQDPYGPVPEHIRLQAADPKHTKVYQFANHGADQFLGGALGKSEDLAKAVQGKHFHAGEYKTACGKDIHRWDPSQLTDDPEGHGCRACGKSPITQAALGRKQRALGKAEQEPTASYEMCPDCESSFKIPKGGSFPNHLSRKDEHGKGPRCEMSGKAVETTQKAEDHYAYGPCKVCGKSHAGFKGLLMHGASKEAVARDTDESDREYAAQRAARRGKLGKTERLLTLAKMVLRLRAARVKTGV
jgi:hypothetical protein